MELVIGEKKSMMEYIVKGKQPACRWGQFKTPGSACLITDSDIQTTH